MVSDRLLKPGKNPCRTCGQPIVWTWNTDKDRWVPTEPSTAFADGIQWIEDPRGGTWPDLPIYTPGIGHKHHSSYCHAGNTSHSEQRSTTNDDFFSRKASLESAYAELFLLPNAPAEIVKAAFRALAQMNHPDRGGDVSKMQRINVAYQKITE